MTKERINELSEEVYQFIFEMLDCEPDMGGYESGEIATEVERVFKDKLTYLVK